MYFCKLDEKNHTILKMNLKLRLMSEDININKFRNTHMQNKQYKILHNYLKQIIIYIKNVLNIILNNYSDNIR